MAYAHATSVSCHLERSREVQDTSSRANDGLVTISEFTAERAETAEIMTGSGSGRWVFWGPRPLASESRRPDISLRTRCSQRF